FSPGAAIPGGAAISGDPVISSVISSGAASFCGGAASYGWAAVLAIPGRAGRTSDAVLRAFRPGHAAPAVAVQVSGDWPPSPVIGGGKAGWHAIKIPAQACPSHKHSRCAQMIPDPHRPRTTRYDPRACPALPAARVPQPF